MTVEDILILTGASRRTFYRWRSNRGFPSPVGIGRFDETEVKGWWEANRDSVGRWPYPEQVIT